MARKPTTATEDAPRSDRERLIELLAELAERPWWVVLQGFWRDKERHDQGAADFAAAARQCREHNPAQADSFRELAEQDARLAEKHRQLAVEMSGKLGLAANLTYRLAPEYLGLLPLADTVTLTTIDPGEAAQRCLDVLGKVNASAGERISGEPLAVERTMPPPAHPNGEPLPKANANARMLDTMQKRPESRHWTAQEWANALDYKSASTIKETPTWKGLANLRANAKAERSLAAAERAAGGRRKRR